MQEKSDEFWRLENQVRHGLEAFAVVGLAFRDIQDSKYWQEGYSSFKEYLKGRWSLSPDRVQWLMDAGSCMNRIFASQSLDKPYPMHEDQVAPLLALPEEEQVPAWREAVANTHGGQPTGDAIQMAVDTRLPIDDDLVDSESLDIQELFAERLAMVANGPPQTVKGLSELFKCSRGEAKTFLMMCEVSPAVQLSRLGDSPTEYEFEATYCVLGRDRISQLARHILMEDHATPNSIECAHRIVLLLGEQP